jgi:hypothetical protein
LWLKAAGRLATKIRKAWFGEGEVFRFVVLRFIANQTETDDGFLG